MMQITEFNWKNFCLHYESEIAKNYSKFPSIAAEKLKELRKVERELSSADLAPDEVIETLMRLVTNNRGELAAFCDPEYLEEPENLIEGYEWCISQLSDKTVSRDVRSMCAAQIGVFDERLQVMDLEI